MATRLYSLNPGDVLENMTEAVGPATTTKAIELNVDLSNLIVTDGATTRTVTKTEVLIALELFQEYIVRSNWPPA